MITSPTREILVKARSLIEDPDDWSPGTEKLTCYCSATAIWHAAGDERTGYSAFSPKAEAAGRALASAAGIDRKEWEWESIYDWNDKSTHADVMATFDRAIGV